MTEIRRPSEADLARITGLTRRAADLATTYAELSAVYQRSKGSGAEIPLA